MKKKRVLWLGLAGCCSLLALAGVSSLSDLSALPLSTKAEEKLQNVSLTAEDAPTTSSTYVDSISKAKGPYSTFVYSKVKAFTSGLCELEKGGCIEKSEACNDLRSITIAFDGELQVETSYSKTGESSQYEVTTLVPLTVSGNYFKIVALKGTKITSITFSYGCEVAATETSRHVLLDSDPEKGLDPTAYKTHAGSALSSYSVNGVAQTFPTAKAGFFTTSDVSSTRKTLKFVYQDGFVLTAEVRVYDWLITSEGDLQNLNKHLRVVPDSNNRHALVYGDFKLENDITLKSTFDYPKVSCRLQGTASSSDSSAAFYYSNSDSSSTSNLLFVEGTLTQADGFAGSFDGGGHTIDYAGHPGASLFGVITTGAKIFDLNLSNWVSMNPGSYPYAAIACSVSGGTFSNITLSCKGLNYGGDRYTTTLHPAALTDGGLPGGILFCRYGGWNATEGSIDALTLKDIQITLQSNWDGGIADLGKFSILGACANYVPPAGRLRFTNVKVEGNSLNHPLLYWKSKPSSGGEKVTSFPGVNDEVFAQASDDPVSTASTIHTKRTLSTSPLDLVSNGTSAYTLAIGWTHTAEEWTAMTTFEKYFKEATGVDLPHRYETDVMDHAIFFGDSQYAKEHGIEYRYEDRSRAGYHIFTEGTNVFILGGSNGGVTYGTFRLLKEWFGLDYFAKGVYKINTGLTSFSADPISIVELPDIETRSNAMDYDAAQHTDYDFINANAIPDYAHSKVVHNHNDEYHNSFEFLDPATYKTSHPEWYTTGTHSDTTTGNVEKPYQLCYYQVLHSDEAYNIVLSAMEADVESHPDHTVFSFTQEDDQQWCDCSYCSAAKTNYGCDTYYYVQWLNKLARGLKAYTPTANPSRKLGVMGISYYKTFAAPAKQENGVYVPIDSSVQLEDNVYIDFAAIQAIRELPLSDSHNATIAGYLEQWKAILGEKNLYLWIYAIGDFQDYLNFSSNYDALSGNYAFAASHGVSKIIDLGPSNEPVAGSFAQLRAYLSSRLAWDSSTDIEPLIDTWFASFYGAAGSYMKQIFSWSRARYKTLADNGTIVWNYGYKNYASKAVFPVSDLKTLAGYRDSALNAVSSDETLTKRVKLDSIFVPYVRCMIGWDAFDSSIDLFDTKIKAKRNDFKTEVTDLGITRWGEHRLIAELWSDWGIS